MKRIAAIVVATVLVTFVWASSASAAVSNDPNYDAVLLTSGLTAPANGLVFRAPTNDVLVTEFGSGQVTRVDASSGAQSLFANVPFADEMAINSRGDVYVKQHPSGPIWRFNSAGAPLSPATFPAPCGSPTGIAFDPADNFYVACHPDRVLNCGSSGTCPSPTVYAAGFQSLEGMDFSPTGRLFVADFAFGRIFEATPGGLTLASHTQWASGLTCPLNVGFDPLTGHLFASSGDRVVRIPAPNVVITFASGFSGGCSGAYDPDFANAGPQFGCLFVDDFATGTIWRFCPLARADKEVLDVVLDDGSGFPDREGQRLQVVSRDDSTRTTTYRLDVRVSTNPIISVVSVERNNGPNPTNSDITFLASNDDGHTPAHVEGAYIPNKGFPLDPNGDLLTCFSVFNPDNPLEQQLNPCPTEEKILGDGRRETAESDLHFQKFQEPNRTQRILRFYKLHCLAPGEHRITFYNKVEPREPTRDLNLGNNWWRAVLILNCGFVADKEVTDLILDDASGFPDREGRPLSCRKDETLARTTRCRMIVEVSTNPIISVVSLDRNNGPDDTESDITFLASNDDNHFPAHVEGAYIPDAGKPKGPEPDLLTCKSPFNPDNPLEQVLIPCPTREKILGDGLRETAESDLHFQLFEKATQQDRILRFYKLHCLVGGRHTITFYNKAEPKPPASDPNLSNNWWRAILDLICVTPGKVTGGGHIDPVTGLPVGDATLLIQESSSPTSIGGKATFGFIIEFESGKPAPRGNLLYNDHAAGVRIKALEYEFLFIVGCLAEFEGEADVNGTEEHMRVRVVDGGEPGSEPSVGPDTFEIETDSYFASGPLVGGNIQIHNGNPC